MKAKEKAMPVKVVQQELDPVPVEMLATSIREIAKAVRTIEASGLTRRALALLLADSSRISMSVIFVVLRHLGTLEADFLEKPSNGGKK